MSYSTPGPQRRDILSFLTPRRNEHSAVEQARHEAERLSTRGPRAPREDGAVSRVRPPKSQGTALGAPPALRSLFDHEQVRVDARGAGDTHLADRALREVVGDLNDLLDTAAAHVRRSGRGRSRQRVKDAIPGLVAIGGLSALPLDEVADLLDLPRDEADAALATLFKDGGISPAERHGTLRRIEELRAQLRQVELTRDHTLLDRLVGFIAKIALMVAVAVAAAPLGALAVGDPVIDEVVKAGVIALVAVALQYAADSVRDRHRRRDPYTVAREAHEALLTELPAAEALEDVPAYDGEHTVIRTRLSIRCSAARMASIPLVWSDKRRYWEILDEIADALDRRSPGTLTHVRRKLRTLYPPRR